MSGEKRSQDSEDTLHAETVIIVDIEGTTSSISYVKETLFPYVRENLKQYIEKNWDNEEFKADLEKLKEQAKKDETDKVEGAVSITGATPEEERETLVKNVLWQMDGDRKTSALKQLQGHIWREGYKSAALKGHVYEDVPRAFDVWTKSGRKIYVYSSGSSEAQKLLFGHSEHGDMTKYLSDYFDTEVGAKQEASSYKNILAKIDVEPSSVMFLTDVVEEAQAAKEAGISAKIVVRPGNAPLTDEDKVKFTTTESFMDLSFQTSAKRQKVEKAEEKEEAAASKSDATIDEPMDTSDEVSAAETSATSENTSKNQEADKKIAEKSKKLTSETAKVEETKTIADKSSEVESSMDVDSKTSETEKKPSDPVIPEKSAETKTKGNEHKTSEKVATPNSDEAAGSVCEIAKKKETPVTATTTTVTKDAEAVTAKPEITEAAKKEVDVTQKENESASKNDTESVKKENAEVVTKKESESTKVEEPATSSVPPTTAAKVENEPMDEVKKTALLSKFETTNATITEDKTEVSAKKAVANEAAGKIEQRNETDASKPTDATIVETTSTPAPVANDKISCPARATSIVAPKDEAKIEKITEGNAMSVEKPEANEAASKAMGKNADSNVKVPSIDEKAKEDAKHNGESSKKTDEAQPSMTDKKDTTHDETETKKSEQAASVAASPETTKSTAEKTSEPVSAETAAKKSETEAETKTSTDETTRAVANESSDPKLNGTAEDTNKNDNEKPHRNGLNGDTTSSTEKSNGDTEQIETAATTSSSSQNGEAEESSSSAATATIAAAASPAESIKTKKVVDSTIVDGAAAGESDVVPPVAVAATS